jgi:hypothetical protein
VIAASLQGQSPMLAEVYDVRGSKVSAFRVTNQNFHLDLSGYEAGMYLLTLTSEQGRFSRRFVKE